MREGVIVVATTAGAVDDVRRQLGAEGVRVDSMTNPGPGRVVCLGSAPDAAATAERLRCHGLMAVSRPSAGAALEAWRRATAPVTIGGRVTIALACSEADRHGRPGLVELGPGGFGNGHHPSTRLLLEVLVDRIAGGERVLDVGCGSGVLALAALRLGAASAVAVDLKEEAVAACRANGVVNEVGERLRASTASVGSLQTVFDVVVANIARAGVVAVADELVDSLAPGGWLAVGGIAPGQGDDVAGHLAPLVEVERVDDGTWAVLVLTGR